MSNEQTSKFWARFYELYSPLLDVSNCIRYVEYFGTFNKLNVCLIEAIFW